MSVSVLSFLLVKGPKIDLAWTLVQSITIAFFSIPCTVARQKRGLLFCILPISMVLVMFRGDMLREGHFYAVYEAKHEFSMPTGENKQRTVDYFRKLRIEKLIHSSVVPSHMRRSKSKTLVGFLLTSNS